MRFGRPREAEQLIDQRVDPIDFVPDQVRKRFPEIGILITLGQSWAKVLIETSGFLISCAMPAESVPRLARRSLRRICNSSRLSAVISVRTDNAPNIS